MRVISHIKRTVMSFSLESLSVSDAADFLSVLKTLLPHLPAGVLESNNDSDSDNSDEEDSVVNVACRHTCFPTRVMTIKMKRLIAS